MDDTGNTTRLNTRRIVMSGMLGALTFLLGYTQIGFIPVPNMTANATIMHTLPIIGGCWRGGWWG